MNETLIIKKLGAIENAVFENLKPFNVFIGPSGNGKSTAMKTLGLFRWLYKMQCMRSYLKRAGITSSPFRLRIDSVLKRAGIYSYIRTGTEVEYRIGNCRIVLRDRRIKFESGLVDSNQLSLEKIVYISDKRTLLSDILEGTLTIRNGMPMLEDTMKNYLTAINTISQVDMRYLGVRLNVKKTSVGRRMFVTPIDTPISQPFTITINNASSGIQNAAPIHLLTTYFVEHYDVVEAINKTMLSYLSVTDNLSKFRSDLNIGKWPNQRVNLHIEEPELSLFPKNQKEIMEYLVAMQNKSNNRVTFTLATHSPYVLTSLFVMMLAWRAEEKVPGSTANIISSDCLLNPTNVSAWYIDNGEVIDIMERDLNLIDGTRLDYASELSDDQISALNEVVYG